MTAYIELPICTWEKRVKKNFFIKMNTGTENYDEK